ncbi:MAG: MoxR family ATPase [Bdellovibrionales bacterium]|nr:MoxR family ATPase [Bdellovibrionales bacterium]
MKSSAHPVSLSSATPSSSDVVSTLKSRLSGVLQGKDELIERAIACFFARGHLLLEGPPGTGKTSLAKGMAGAFGGKFSRVQMTSDLLPSDVVGILRMSPTGKDFEFREGPIFAHFLLADELNRTTPKTQSALLEAMEEGTVTVDGKSYALPNPFFVVATQNPLEFHGVYPLAESQLDRFMMLLEFTSPSEEAELRIYQRPDRAFEKTPTASDQGPLMTLDEGRSARVAIDGVHVEESVLRYLMHIVRETRNIVGIGHGVSVRGGLQYLQAAKALAFVRGREFVLPRDVRDLAVPCLAHRLFFNGMEIENLAKSQMIQEILSRIPEPK